MQVEIAVRHTFSDAASLSKFAAMMGEVFSEFGSVRLADMQPAPTLPISENAPRFSAPDFEPVASAPCCDEKAPGLETPATAGEDKPRRSRKPRSAVPELPSAPVTAPAPVAAPADDKPASAPAVSLEAFGGAFKDRRSSDFIVTKLRGLLAEHNATNVSQLYDALSPEQRASIFAAITATPTDAERLPPSKLDHQAPVAAPAAPAGGSDDDSEPPVSDDVPAVVTLDAVMEAVTERTAEAGFRDHMKGFMLKRKVRKLSDLEEKDMRRALAHVLSFKPQH